MNKDLISVIVPVYNAEGFLKVCVESVISQSYQNWELILINDGSTDKSRDICDSFTITDHRIKVIHKVNGGVSSARNMGIDVSKGEYITFLDSDDFWHRDYLKILHNLCIHNNAQIAQCGFIRGNDRIFPKIGNNYRISLLDNNSVFLKGIAKIILWAKLYKSELFHNLRIPENKFFEDDFTTWKLYYRSIRIVVTNQKLYYYFNNNQSTMAMHSKKPNLVFIDAYIERIQFFQEKREIALEDNTRAHLCKSMILLGSNQNLTNDQRETAGITFNQNWKKIHKSKYVPYKLRCLFFAYQIFPGFVHMIIRHVRGI